MQNRKHLETHVCLLLFSVVVNTYIKSVPKSIWWYDLPFLLLSKSVPPFLHLLWPQGAWVYRNNTVNRYLLRRYQAHCHPHHCFYPHLWPRDKEAFLSFSQNTWIQARQFSLLIESEHCTKTFSWFSKPHRIMCASIFYHMGNLLLFFFFNFFPPKSRGTLSGILPGNGILLLTGKVDLFWNN